MRASALTIMMSIAAKTVPIYVDATRKAVDSAIAADEAAQKALGADSAFYWNFNVTRSRRWRRHDPRRVHASRECTEMRFRDTLCHAGHPRV